MESLLGEKPYMAPLSTISSTGTETFKSKSISSSSMSSGCTNDICSKEASDMNIYTSRKSA